MDGFATMFLMVSAQKIGTSAIQTRATAGVAGATYISACPARPGPAGMPGTRSSCINSTTAIAPAISSRSCRASTSICAAPRRRARRCEHRLCPFVAVPTNGRGSRGSQLQIPGLAHPALAELVVFSVVDQREAPLRSTLIRPRPRRRARSRSGSTASSRWPPNSFIKLRCDQQARARPRLQRAAQ